MRISIGSPCFEKSEAFYSLEATAGGSLDGHRTIGARPTAELGVDFFQDVTLRLDDDRDSSVEVFIFQLVDASHLFEPLFQLGDSLLGTTHGTVVKVGLARRPVRLELIQLGFNP